MGTVLTDEGAESDRLHAARLTLIGKLINRLRVIQPVTCDFTASFPCSLSPIILHI